MPCFNMDASLAFNHSVLMEIKQLHKQLLCGDIKWGLDEFINLDGTGEVLLMHLNNKGAQMATEMLRELLKKNPAEPYKQMSFVKPASEERGRETLSEPL